MKTPYKESFYEHQSSGSYSSANVIVPLVLNLLPIKSVVDVGCGLGTWLSVFKEKGVSDILGIDGDWVDTNKLYFSPKDFLQKDLEKPFNLNKKFDLAVSLEVAEHVRASSAPCFVKNLTQLSSVILFSAAIPYQGGTHHVNEQWPSYWVELFKMNNYVAFDLLRSKVWSNPDVQPWYAQNTIIFVEESSIDKHNAFNSLNTMNNQVLSLVHPNVYLKNISKNPILKLREIYRKIKPF